VGGIREERRKRWWVGGVSLEVVVVGGGGRIDENDGMELEQRIGIIEAFAPFFHLIPWHLLL